MRGIAYQLKFIITKTHLYWCIESLNCWTILQKTRPSWAPIPPQTLWLSF